MKKKIMNLGVLAIVSVAIITSVVVVNATSVTKTLGYKGKAETTMYLNESISTSIQATALSGKPEILTTMARHSWLGWITSAKNTTKVETTDLIYHIYYTGRGNDINTRATWENQSDDTSITGIFSLTA